MQHKYRAKSKYDPEEETLASTWINTLDVVILHTDAKPYSTATLTPSEVYVSSSLMKLLSLKENDKVRGVL